MALNILGESATMSPSGSPRSREYRQPHAVKRFGERAQKIRRFLAGKAVEEEI